MEWKTFRLNGRLLAAYTMKDSFLDEEEATLGLLAYENHCRTDDIAVAIEDHKPE